MTAKLHSSLLLLVPAFVFLATSCTEKQPPPASPARTAVAMDQFSSRPEKIREAKDSEGGMCPVDFINRQSKKPTVSTSKGQPFGIEGWVVIASREQPAPPFVFAILKGAGDAYYLEGKRKARPDVAKGDQLLALAGFEVAGYLANVPAGQYGLSIGTGTSKSLTVCKTDVAVTVVE